MDGWISRGSIGSVGDQLGLEGICVDGLVGFGLYPYMSFFYDNVFRWADRRY